MHEGLDRRKDWTARIEQERLDRKEKTLRIETLRIGQGGLDKKDRAGIIDEKKAEQEGLDR